MLVELEFGDDGFCGGRKTGEPGEKSSEQGENQQQTQPTYGTGPESNSGHIGEKRALSPLSHPCSQNWRAWEMTTATPRTTPSKKKKMNLYFAFEFRKCLDLLSARIGLKTCSS